MNDFHVLLGEHFLIQKKAVEYRYYRHKRQHQIICLFNKPSIAYCKERHNIVAMSSPPAYSCRISSINILNPEISRIGLTYIHIIHIPYQTQSVRVPLNKPEHVTFTQAHIFISSIQILTLINTQRCFEFHAINIVLYLECNYVIQFNF